MLTANLRQLELGDFCKSNVFGREKYAEFSELSLKIHDFKIQPVFQPRTQIWKETFYTKIQKVILEAFHDDFLLKIGIIWFRNIRKTSHSTIMRARSKPLPKLIMES